ncbi:MAG TPA: FliM/FliN family flagellar motor switch protein [Bryobacteraceae bacterium]|nr:FliM/FliN family flagellar motor switch protein [Bryobacteraceae bacterium]
MAEKPEIESFFEHWTGEFSRAIEMFTGEAPVVTYARVAPAARQEIEKSQLAGRLWWKQPVEGEGSFSSWTGAVEECWSGLGGAVDDKSDPRRMYLEMLGQANQGTAAAISAGFPRPLRCGEGAEADVTSLGTLEVAEVNVVFRGNELPSLLLAIEPSAARVLRLPETKAETRLQTTATQCSVTQSPASQSPMMSRLLELRLPVSVLLGRTSISIRDVLNLATGSIIELDRKIGDYVEIVVHGTVVARGEIVSVSGNYGVRIKEVISREDRLALRDAA